MYPFRYPPACHMHKLHRALRSKPCSSMILSCCPSNSMCSPSIRGIALSLFTVPYSHMWHIGTAASSSVYIPSHLSISGFQAIVSRPALVQLQSSQWPTSSLLAWIACLRNAQYVAPLVQVLFNVAWVAVAYLVDDRTPASSSVMV